MHEDNIASEREEDSGAVNEKEQPNQECAISTGQERMGFMAASAQSCQTAVTPAQLSAYLRRTLVPSVQEAMKHHLDVCPECHERWNRFRWDQAKGKPGYQEWVRYLSEQGEPLVEYLDSSCALITQWRERSPQTLQEREWFFRQTPYYLSNLVVWHESGHRPPYVAEALPLLQYFQARTICDFGCGIGSDGLKFLDAGYQVLFCEFDNPSSRFLRWRLQQRHLPAPWIEPVELPLTGSFDTLWAMDVFDHLPDLRVLVPLLDQCRLLCYENQHQQKTHGGSSFHLSHSPEAFHTLWTHAGFHHVVNTPSLTWWSKPVL